jgi:3-carboxy-cis,cis-muconate cycloisomerase
MAQDQERATGPWQSEQLALPQIFVLTAGALRQAAALAQGMAVDAARMRRNLDVSDGLIMAEAAMMALAGRMGRDTAHHVVQAACDRALAERRPLLDALAATPEVAQHLDRPALARILDPAHYLGEARDVVDRMVARVEERVGA